MVNIQKQNLNFQTEKLRVEALAKIDLIKSFEKFGIKFEHRLNAEKTFLELYNSGEYLKDIFQILGKVSKSSLYRWNKTYSEYGTIESLIPKYKCTTIQEYNTTLTPEMIEQFKKFLFHPNRFKVSKQSV